MLLAVCIAVHAAGVLVLDLAAPAGVVWGVLYSLIVLLALLFPRREYSFYVAAYCSLLIIAAGLRKAALASADSPTIFVANGALELATVWTVAAFVYLKKGLDKSLVDTRDSLERTMAQRSPELARTTQVLETEIGERERGGKGTRSL